MVSPSYPRPCMSYQPKLPPPKLHFFIHPHTRPWNQKEPIHWSFLPSPRPWSQSHLLHPKAIEESRKAKLDYAVSFTTNLLATKLKVPTTLNANEAPAVQAVSFWFSFLNFVIFCSFVLWCFHVFLVILWLCHRAFSLFEVFLESHASTLTWPLKLWACALALVVYGPVL